MTSATSTSRSRRAAAWLLIVAMATGFRLASWPAVFDARGTNFLSDTDPHYHLLRARQAIEQGAVPWIDPALNHPRGATIPWPPLWDALLASAGRLAGASPGHLEPLDAAAAVVPVLFGVVAVVLLGLLASTLLGVDAILAAFLLALLPLHVSFTVLGRPDQHAAEQLVLIAVLLAFVRATARSGPFPAPAATLTLGALLTLAVWTWLGSPLYLLLLLGTAGVLHLAAPADDAWTGRALLAVGCSAALAALLLTTSILLFAPPGRLSQGGLGGVGGFHVAAFALGGAWALLLALLRRSDPLIGPVGRAVQLLLATALPGAAAILAFPVLRSGASSGLDALLLSHPWYGEIGEFFPLVFSGRLPAATELRGALGKFGLLLPLTPLAIWLLLRRYRATRAPSLLVAAFWIAVFLLFTLLRQRFGIYLTGAAAAGGALVLESAAGALAPRFPGRERLVRAAAPWVLATACLLPALALAWGDPPWGPAVRPGQAELLRFLGDTPAPAPDRDGVLAPWDAGHLVRFFARKPVLSSPFGTEGGDGALTDAVTIFRSTDGPELEAGLAERHLGFVYLVDPPGFELTELPWPPAVRGRSVMFLKPNRWHGSTYEILPAYFELPVVRLFAWDGLPRPGSSAASLDGFRLIGEVIPPGAGPTLDGVQKLFEAVRGARLEVSGGTPGARSVAWVDLLTNAGRRVRWSMPGVADEAGATAWRLPYSSGGNGLVFASAWHVDAPNGEATVEVAEAAVLGGHLLRATLPPPRRPPAP